MGLVRTDAVILRAIDYSESSKILTLLSPAHGRVSVIAKGAKRPKSPFAGGIEPLAQVVAVYADKESREVQTLSQCDMVEPFAHMKRDLTALGAASYLAEVAGTVAQERHAAPELYRALCLSLALLDHAPALAPGIVLWGLRRVLDAAGLAPSVERCIVCGGPPRGAPLYFNPRAGGVTCRSCHQAGSRPLTPAGYAALRAAGAEQPQETVHLDGVCSALNALDEHVVYHVDHPCKSFEFLYDRLTAGLAESDRDARRRRRVARTT